MLGQPYGDPDQESQKAAHNHQFFHWLRTRRWGGWQKVCQRLSGAIQAPDHLHFEGITRERIFSTVAGTRSPGTFCPALKYVIGTFMPKQKLRSFPHRCSSSRWVKMRSEIGNGEKARSWLSNVLVSYAEFKTR